MPTERERTKEAAREELSEAAFGTVTKVYYHTEADDGSNNEVDVELESGTTIPGVHVPTLAPGMVTLPEEDSLVRVAPTGGAEGEPVVTGVYYDAQDRAPLSKKGDWRVRIDDAVFETRLNQQDQREIRVGRQPDDGGPIDMGLIMNNETGSLKLLDGSGEGIEMDGSGNISISGFSNGGDGGTGPGAPGGGYPSIPTGGAGGDGTGVGSPGYSFSSTVDAVADLGFDKTGNQPINSKLKSAAASNKKIELPAGTYKVDPPSDGKGIVFDGLSNFALLGKGDKRTDVRFVFPKGKAGRIFNFGGSCSNIWLGNFVFDQSTHQATYIEMNCTSSGDIYMYNLAHVGRPVNEADSGQPGDPEGNQSAISFAMSSGATAHLENYKNTAPPNRVISYGGSANNSQGLYAGTGNEGLVEIVAAHIAYKGEHAFYCSRSNGPIHVQGGYFHNNINTNARIAGQGSWIKNATIHIDMDPSFQRERDTGDTKAVRGLRVENQKNGASGGYVENTDFILEGGASGPGIIEVDGSVQNFEIRDCRIRADGSNMPVIAVLSGATGTSVSGGSITGSTTHPAVDSSADTSVSNVCVDLPNASQNFVGCSTSGITSKNCPVAKK